jgi:protein TonB
MKMQWTLAGLALALVLAVGGALVAPASDDDDVTVVAAADTVVTAPDVLPQFDGGESAMYQFLLTHILWPNGAPDEDVNVRALVEFVVEKDGSLTNVVLKESTGYEVFDSEAVRVVRQMPNWTPGRSHGEVVRTTFVLPIRFKSSSGNDLK